MTKEEFKETAAYSLALQKLNDFLSCIPGLTTRIHGKKNALPTLDVLFYDEERYEVWISFLDMIHDAKNMDESCK